MENTFRSQLFGKLDYKEQQTNTLCVPSEMHSENDSNCHFSGKNSKNLHVDVTDAKNEKSLKISSVLDVYCKTSILDESDDFMDCELKNKLKKGATQEDVLLCEICKENITHLELYQRELHVNKCIDKQIPSSSTSSTTTQAFETDNVFILECPLCFKHFSTPELRSNHIKKCGKSKGLSVQSIIKALELQERHALERISLGLPAKPVKPPKPPKTSSLKRAIVEPKNKTEMDIQLAKALSLSLSSQNEDMGISENMATVTLKPPAAHQRPGKKTKTNISPPLLVLRSEEDRKNLLLEKVASIVTPMSNSDPGFSVTSETTTSTV